MWILSDELPESGVIVVDSKRDMDLIRREHFPPVDLYTPENIRKLYCECCVPDKYRHLLTAGSGNGSDSTDGPDSAAAVNT